MHSTDAAFFLMAGNWIHRSGIMVQGKHLPIIRYRPYSASNQNADFELESLMPGVDPPLSIVSEAPEKDNEQRTYFPETWLWQLTHIP